MAGDREFDPERLKELMLYVASECADDPTFDNETLNHILFMADARAYAELGQSITGAEYIRE